jgi:hypothetical protein
MDAMQKLMPASDLGVIRTTSNWHCLQVSLRNMHALVDMG